MSVTLDAPLCEWQSWQLGPNVSGICSQNKDARRHAEKDLDEIIVQGPHGVRLVPGASGIQNMAELSPAEHAGIISAFSQSGADIDTLIVDTAAGISDTVISFTRAAQEVIVVVCDEPAS